MSWSPVQLLFKQLGSITDETLQKALFKKMAPPLVTLLSAESEIQYVALRNINLIVQKYPAILAHEVKVQASSSLRQIAESKGVCLAVRIGLFRYTRFRSVGQCAQLDGRSNPNVHAKCRKTVLSAS